MFFCYIYYTAEGVAYYVGKGNRTRVFMRHAIPVPQNKELIQCFEFQTEQEAWETEIDLIAHFGRKCDGGTLLNLSTGGKGGTQGVTWSDERRADCSRATKERLKVSGHPQQGKTGANCHNSKMYLVKFPSGSLLEVKGLTDFCRKHNLTPSAMVAVSKGKRSHHKGYTVERINA